MEAEAGSEGIILQPLWKIHNIDWSDRRNVFETEPSYPCLELLRRKASFISRYDSVRDSRIVQFGDKYDKIRDYGKQLNSWGYRPMLYPKWPRLGDGVRSSA